MNSKILTVFVSLIVAGLVVGASLPTFATFTASSETVHNDGAGWVRFDLNKSADTTYNIGISWDENGYYLANGSNVQTYDDNATSDFETILYADSNVGVWVGPNGDNVFMLGKSDGSPVMAEFADPVSIVRDSEGVVISDGSDSYAFGVPEWAYIPWSGGSYGFFAYDAERGVTVPNGTPTAVIGGGFAGVYAYNDILRYDGLGLEMSALTGEDGLYYGAEWVKPVAPEELDITPIPGIIHPGEFDTMGASDSTTPNLDLIDPFDPGAEIMAVPTPAYSDGVWGYNIIQVDGVDKAVIVSYSGTGGGDLVVPATVGGYNVHRLGISLPISTSTGGSQSVFSDDLPDTRIILSEGIVEIGARCCYYNNHIKGVTLPSTLEKIGNFSFAGTGFIGSLIIPDSVDFIGEYAFHNQSGITSLKLPKAISDIGKYAFNNVGATGDFVFPESFINIDQYTFALTKFSGSLIVPDGVNAVGKMAFSNMNNMTDTLVVPQSVLTIGNGAFGWNYFKNVIIASDAIPEQNGFYSIQSNKYVLDLSDAVDYSVDRYGITYGAIISDSIGDCFGYVAVVDIAGGDNGAVGDLIALLPVVMLAGIVLFSIVALAINRK